MQLSENRARTIEAEFERIAIALRTLRGDEGNAIVDAIERANKCGVTVTFLPEYVSVNVPEWTSAACAVAGRTHLDALATCCKALADRAAYERRQGMVYP